MGKNIWDLNIYKRSSEIRSTNCGNYIKNGFLKWTIYFIKTSVLPTCVSLLSICVGALGLGKEVSGRKRK